MARPTFRIWKDKPDTNRFGQYIDIQNPDEYQYIGFDTFDIEDDFYTTQTRLGRGSYADTDRFWINPPEDLGDYMYGVGQLRINNWLIGGNWTDEHDADIIKWYFIDSADFQCNTGLEDGCVTDLPDGQRIPQDYVSPYIIEHNDGTYTVGDLLVGGGSIHNNWMGNFAKDKNRMYQAHAGSNFDCYIGGDNEWGAPSQHDIVGNSWPDSEEGAALNYYWGGTAHWSAPGPNDGVWLWKFFPRMRHENVSSTIGYNYSNTRADWSDILRGDVFSNAVNSEMQGSEYWPEGDYHWDYEDGPYGSGIRAGSFYFMSSGWGYYCDYAWQHQGTPTTYTIYAIPKKHIYDHWNGTKDICFQFGTRYNCDTNTQIVYRYRLPITLTVGGGSPFWSGKDMKITITPPRKFYHEDTVADDFRPVNNIGSERKNPAQKDPAIYGFRELDDCIYPGQSNECDYSSFYPYVADNLPYLYSPYYWVNFRGNIAGITDGTMGYERPDLGIIGDWSILDGETNVSPYSSIYTIDNDYINDRNYRPISYAWVDNDDIDLGLTVQRDYEENSLDHTKASAPNIVKLWMHPAEPINAGADIKFHDLSPEFWANDIYLKTGMGYKWCVARWGDEISNATSDFDINQEIIGGGGELETFMVSPTHYYMKNLEGLYDWVDIKNDFGLGILQHQYQMEGPKTIKALIFSFIYNRDQDEPFQRIFPEDNAHAFQTFEWKLVDIKINLTLSGVFVEDFTEVGGSDFKFIPMKTVTPIIGGLHDKSKYIRSLDKIYAANLFDSTEIIEKIQTKKAKVNDNLGFWPGKMDIEQVRMFNKPIDMHKLLDIENNILPTPNRIRMFDYMAHWDGIEYFYSSETSINQIFIDDNVDTNLKSACVLELNAFNLSGNKILDSSGHGNIGILLGDYGLIKNDKFEPIIRDRKMKTPNIGKKDGAF